MQKYHGGVTMIGLTIGAVLCSLGDHIGRKSILLHGLIIHFLFNIGTAIAPTFDVLLTSRLASSIGLGICYPAACIYLAEFLPQNSRGKLSVLLLFWALGGFYVLFLAYSLLPDSGEQVISQAKDHSSNWHYLFFLSSLPTVFAIISIFFASESIRFLLYKGKDVNAIMMYQKMYKWSASRSAQYQLTELELPRKIISSKPPPPKSVWNQIIYSITEYFGAIKQLGMRQNTIPIVLLSLTWAALGFSYYSISSWVPQQLHNLKDIDYFAQMRVERDKEEFGKTYNYGLENQLFENVTFESCVFSSIISHVIFKNCVFNNSDFSGIHSSKTYFIDSMIENTRIYDTDFTDNRFINTEFIKVSYFSTRTPCRNDLDFRIRLKDKLTENMLRLISPLLALTIHNLCLYKFSRNKVGGASMLICSLMSIACWFLNDQIAVLVFDFVYSIIFLFSFNSVNIITVEAFPVHLRATGFGFCFAWFRLFGLLSSHVVLIIPLTITLLLIGGISLFRLQDTSFNLM
nr:synaptic vesicle glycoprotein 2B-like isoform X2 [Halyomorpha halys]